MSPIITVGIKAARRAGSIILRYLDRLDQLSVEKKGRNDFVSEVDRMAEEDIIDTIHYLYPNHQILAEESGTQFSPDLDKPDHERNSLDEQDVEWIIDPLDGTTNYLHGHPHFCVSIAARIKGRIEHAIIFDPLRDEIYTASRGQGAQLNSRRIRVSGQAKLENSLVSTGYPTRNMTHYDPWMSSLRSVLPRVSNIRYSGSAALDLAYVASGRTDGYWEPGLAIWDIAAGSLLVREAGGLVSDFKGGQDYLQSGHIVAGNQRLFNQLLSTVKSRTGTLG
ncbi:MAG: inositol monophosphatase [Gammaproteobacteria bacterium]|nr:inositol monophosphatase [Gammaproteobacteria bacterium]